MDNIFDLAGIDLAEELQEDILNSPNVRIKRIVSDGHRSPEGFYYDQADNEWVIILQGNATVELSGNTHILSTGDYIHIPSHAEHRINSTSTTEKTIWLAIHY